MTISWGENVNLGVGGGKSYSPVAFKLEIMPAIIEGRAAGSSALVFLDELLSDAISVNYQIDTASPGVRQVLMMLVNDESVPSFNQERFEQLCGIQAS